MKKAASSTSSDKPVSMDRSSRKRVTSSSSSSSSSPCHSNSTSITSSSSIARRSISNSSCPTVRRLFPAAAAVTTSKHVQKQLQLKQIKPFKVEVEGTNKQKEEEEEEEEEKKEEEEEDDDDELDDDEEDEEEEDEDEEKETESEVEEVDRADSCLSASTSWVPSIRHLSHSPSIRLITNFLNVNQVKEIMEWKNKHKWSFDRSSTTGGITDIRTSFEMEYMGSLVSLLKKRVVILTGMSKQHIEGFQLIRYEKGQEFKPHVDSNNLWIYKSSGMRIYSLIIYLNTMTKKQGGATGTLDDMTCDENCEHAGEPVIGGTKFVLVAWVTQHPVWDP